MDERKPIDNTGTLYEGTKRLYAWPMDKKSYCYYRGRKVPVYENPGEAGYLVEYMDGGKPNDSRHRGYISWLPADVFERTYHAVEAVSVSQAVGYSTSGKDVRASIVYALIQNGGDNHWTKPYELVEKAKALYDFIVTGAVPDHETTIREEVDKQLKLHFDDARIAAKRAIGSGVPSATPAERLRDATMPEIASGAVAIDTSVDNQYACKGE